MRPLALALAASVATAMAAPRVASADPMDPALARLTHDASNPSVPCANVDPNLGPIGAYRPGAQPCVFDNTAFRRLINQYGFAFAPQAMSPARTTGFAGFQIAVQGSFTSIDKGADYWRKGTQGPVDPNSGQRSVQNPEPDSWLQVYNFNLRKGLPYGIELGVNVGYMAHTSIMSGGADVRWALLEGFRTGVLGYLPDVAIGTGVRTITGTPDFQLTIVSLDGVVSKPIPIADSSVITPYLGYQFIRIFGDSGIIDATPATDSLSYCNFRGQRVPGGFAEDDGKGPYTGQPVCGDGASGRGSADDFANNRVFNRTRVNRHRLVAGFSYRYEMVVIGGQFITDVIDPSSANSGVEKQDLAGVPRQQTIAVQAGVAF